MREDLHAPLVGENLLSRPWEAIDVLLESTVFYIPGSWAGGCGVPVLNTITYRKSGYPVSPAKSPNYMTVLPSSDIACVTDVVDQSLTPVRQDPEVDILGFR